MEAQIIHDSSTNCQGYRQQLITDVIANSHSSFAHITSIMKTRHCHSNVMPIISLGLVLC
jgi:hypothetical protein